MMKNELELYAIQYEIRWEDPTANIRIIEQMISGFKQLPDILLLPETFTSGFTNEAERCAEPMDGSVMSRLKAMAKRTQIAIGGSLIVREQGQFFNRFVFVRPDGVVDYYDKRHLFSMSGEDKVYGKGYNRVIINYKGWRILLQICYDLRFPVWSRNKGDYDLILYTANWPSPRQHVWDILLKARAIENQCYVFGVNRTGTDGNGIVCKGHTQCIDPRGNTMNEPHSDTGVIAVTVQMDELLNFRMAFPVLDDRDSFIISDGK